MRISLAETNNFKEPRNGIQAQLVESLGLRLSRYCVGHWDINAIFQLREDLRASLILLDSELPGVTQTSIDNIIHVLSHCISASKLPDSGQTAQLLMLSNDLFDATRILPASEFEAAPAIVQRESGNTRFETPPKAFWRQWSQDASPAIALNLNMSQNKSTQEVYSPRTTAMTNSIEPQAGKPNAIGSEAAANYQRIYHLTDYSETSVELDQILELKGYDIELLNSEIELDELLLALPADLILIDPQYSDKSEALQNIIGQYKRLNTKPLVAVQLYSETFAAAALSVGNAIIDAVYSQTLNANSLASNIDKLLRFGKADQYRVLIVEDDRSQAMFAEGVLRNAEISTKVLLSAENLLPTIDSFKPDLILMDMHLPNANGIELTELIRNSNHFPNTPIVFLSGETDEEKQMDALEAGGDDFLTKPIQPRRLIVLVQNRIKRNRSLQKATLSMAALANSNGGLLHRTDMLDLLKKDALSTKHALMYIEINGFSLLKERLGLSALESLLKQFSRYLVETCSPQPVARFSDGAFVMAYQGDCSDSTMTSFAATIRQTMMAQKFKIDEQSIEPQVIIGICQYELAANTDLLINAAERSAREARLSTSGISIYKPQASGDVQKEEHIIHLLNGIEQHNLFSHVYQPIVAVAGSDEKQFQTLLRLQDDNGQLIPAAEFIPIAEKSNLIINIDRWSIAHAVATIAKQNDAGIEIKLFVNQSNVTILANEQLAWLNNLLKANKIPDNSLVIEISHDDALLNQKSIQEFCQALIYTGLQFCLSRYNPKNDDTNLLENLPLSYLKLAPSLTAGLASQGIRDQIKIVVERAHRQGLEVIGHNVEDAQTAATLWMSGIDYIQGNLVQSANVNLDFGFDQSVL